MTKEKKQIIIENLVKQLSLANYFYIVDSAGLTVAQVNNFRKICFEQGVVYNVVKNTLLKKAFEKLENNTEYSIFNDKVLKGFSGILISKDIARAPATILKDFSKQQKSAKPALKGTCIDEEYFIGAQYLDALSKLKTKPETIGEIINLLQSPVKNVIASLQSSKQKLAGILKTLSEKQS